MTEELNVISVESVASPTTAEPASARQTLNGAAAPTVNPLAELFGKYRDEPLWNEWMAEIEAYRRARNAQEDTE